MSRSRRKKPIFGNLKARSEKEDKRQAHKVQRAKVREWLAREDWVKKDPPLERETSNVWSMAKDGKKWYKVLWERWWSK